MNMNLSKTELTTSKYYEWSEKNKVSNSRVSIMFFPSGKVGLFLSPQVSIFEITLFKTPLVKVNFVRIKKEDNVKEYIHLNYVWLNCKQCQKKTSFGSTHTKVAAQWTRCLSEPEAEVEGRTAAILPMAKSPLHGSTARTPSRTCLFP